MVRKDTRFDVFSPSSGERIGSFAPDGLIPWHPEELIPSPPKLNSGKKYPSRVVPLGFVFSKDEHVLQYNEALCYEVNPDDMDSLTFTVLEVMWNCPDPDFGSAVVTANVRIRGEDKWQQLSYSLRESAIR